MKKLLVILGPTATGKTDLALSLAKKFNGELVSADSRQVYAGLDIGTGKFPGGRWKIENRKWIVNGILIHMYDVVDPKTQYNVADYVKEANKVISDIVGSNKLPIVVGGTGLYLKALLYGLPNLAIPMNTGLRKKLEKLSKEQLQRRLQTLSIERWEKMNQSDRQNLRRLVRAIELVLMQNSKFKIQNYNSKFKIKQADILKIGLTAPRDILYKRVDEGVNNRIDQGIIEEAKKLHKQGLTYKRMRQLGLEYGVLADFLQGRIKTKAELINTLQGKIHGFVRRQLTWFKKEKDPPASLPAGTAGRAGVTWFDITEKKYLNKMAKLVRTWYDSKENNYAAQDRHIA